MSAADVTVSLDTVPLSSSVSEGEAFMVTLSGDWSADPAAGTVYLQAWDDSGALTAPPVAAAPKTRRYGLTLSLPATSAAGQYGGTLSVRACADVQCTVVHAGTTRSVTYKVDVRGIGDWETMQRDAAHSGYVPIRLQPDAFQKAWEWQRPMDGVLNALNAPVTAGGKVIVSEDEYAGRPSVYAFDGATGGMLWRHQFSLSNSPSLGPPTAVGDTVYVSTAGHSDSYLHALKLSNGLTRFASPFASQWSNMFAPTISGGRACVNAGYYGGVVYAYSEADGTSLWNTPGGTSDVQSCAADGSYFYVHNGSGLQVFDAANGTLKTSIGTGATAGSGTYFGAPMLGSPDNVIAFNSTAWSGRASSSQEPTASRQLMNYSVAEGALRWASLRTYNNTPAVARGVVYAGSNQAKTLDALDEATGQILWSVSVPESAPSFRRNVVVTENIVLFSTETTLYAYDLEKRKIAWKAPTPGAIAISSTRMMFVTTGGLQSNGKLVAYRLR